MSITEHPVKTGEETTEKKNPEVPTMIKTVAIVSLSSGIIGESFVRHEVEIGLRRLRDFGLEVRFMPHALKGLEYVRDHPEKRAEDLLAAFRDPQVDMILCAIGGGRYLPPAAISV